MPDNTKKPEPITSYKPGDESIEVLLEAAKHTGPADMAGLVVDKPAWLLADVIESLPFEQRHMVWHPLDPQSRGQVLLQVPREVRRQLIEETSSPALVELLRTLESDELADLDGDLPDEAIDQLVQSLPARQQADYRLVSQYPDDTAGGLMDLDAQTVRPDVSLRVVQRYLRNLRHEHDRLPEHLDSLIVVDRDRRYLGLLHLSDIVSLPPETIVHQAMNREVPTIGVSEPATRVAQRFADRDLLSAAVVDSTDQVLGRITIDDVVDVIAEEAERTQMQRVGLTTGTDLFAPAWRTAWHRSVWLAVNLINGAVAATIIGQFEQSIEKLVALAVLMPIVASMGGVAGNQTLTLVIRGLALEQVRSGNTMRLLAQEVKVGLLNGLLWAVVVAIAVGLWFSSWPLGAVFGAALLLNMLVGAAAGTLLPVLLKRVGIDPALAGGVALMAATDVIGFASFLGLATWLLM